jgi:hypothetical protein
VPVFGFVSIGEDRNGGGKPNAIIWQTSTSFDDCREVIDRRNRAEIERIADLLSGMNVPSWRKLLVEGDHFKIRFHPKIHLPEGSIPDLGGEDMMSHGLDVPKASFQGAGRSDRSRSRKATSEVHRLYRARHRVGTSEQ